MNTELDFTDRARTLSGGWLPPKRIGRPPRVPPVGAIEPGLAFVLEHERYGVVDRASGELLGTIWRTAPGTWSAVGPDGEFLAAGLHGTRHDIGLQLQLMASRCHER